MPFEITFEPRGAYKRFWGVVSGSEIVDSTFKVQAHPDYDRFRYSINDMLGVESFAYTDADIETLAVHNLGAMRTNPRVKIAVVSNHARATEIIRALASGRFRSHPMKVFETLDDARKWVES